MFAYIVKRILIFVPTFLVISLFIFALSKFAPGDPVDLLLKGKNEASSSSLSDLVLSENSYAKTAEALGLDKPTFYFSLSTLAYPDSLYKIQKQQHRELISRLIDQYGNAEPVLAYYHKLRKLEFALAQIPEKALRPESQRLMRRSMNKLYFEYAEAAIRFNLDTMAHTAKQDPGYSPVVALFAELEISYQTIQEQATPYRLYLPSINIYGINNQYHIWLFGDQPWFSSIDSTPHKELEKLRIDYDVLRPQRDSFNIIMRNNKMRTERNRSYLDTASAVAPAEADSIEAQIALWQADNAKQEQALAAILPELEGLEEQIKLLDKSLPKYVGRGFLRGDFGISYFDNKPVSSKIFDALYWTLIMNFFSIFISYLISIPLGVNSAMWKLQGRKAIDGANTTVLFILYSLPSFWIAVLCVLFFTNPEYGMHWFPAGGAYSQGLRYEEVGFFAYLGDVLYHLALPIFCITYASFAYLSRQMRGSMLSVIRQDYIRTARSKGLSEGKVVWKHAFRNSLFPIITLFGSVFPRALSGSIAIEFIFNIPGMGSLVLESINSRDWPVVFTVAMFGAILTMLGNLIADILYAYADPRVSYNKK